MLNLMCDDCPYQFKGGVIIDCRECLDEEDLEAQRVDAAERENHRKDVEGEEIF